MLKHLLFFLFCIHLISCSNDINQVNALVGGLTTSKDIGKKIKIIYSDSAQVKVIVEAPLLERYNDVYDAKDVFPQGILITFLDQTGQAESWLKANEGIRDQKTKTMIVRGNVAFYNRDNEKLQSQELIWDEVKKKIYTDKFIRITRPIQGDTIFGMGFEADQNFERLEIKRRMQGKINIDSPAQ